MTYSTIVQDIRYAIRTLLNAPAFTAVAVVALALGIGANTAIFSVVSGVLLRPLPFARPDALVQLHEADPRNGIGAVAYPDLVDWRKEATTLESIIAYSNVSKNLQGVDEPERIATVSAERGLFRMLGVEPIEGRTFRDDDPPGVVVIGAGLWKRRFGADPGLIGRKIVLDGEGVTVIGVMPEKFQFPYRASYSELWIPFDAPPLYTHNRYYHADFVTGRLKPARTIEEARNELSVIATHLGKQYPDTNAGRTAVVTPLADEVTGSARKSLLVLLGAVGLVLLIACANVANLLLARASMRIHEMAVRSALGAGRGRLIRQFLTESLLLAIAGGVAGLFLAIWGRDLLLKLAATEIPRSWEIGLDWRVFAFLLVVCIATGIGFGIAPALSATRIDVQRGLKEAGARASAGRRQSRMCDGLIVAEIGLSFVLLAGAGLLLRTFLHLENTPTGLVTENVLTLRVSVSQVEYPTDDAVRRYYREMEGRIIRIPGVRAAGFIQVLPLESWGWRGWFSIVGRPLETGASAELRFVSPGYFRALGIPIRRGRGFTERDDDAASHGILINEALAHRYFPNEDPEGREISRGTIIGVVGDVHDAGLGREPQPEIFSPLAQQPYRGVTLVVSGLMPPEALTSSVRGVIHQVNPNQAVFNVKTMERVVADSLSSVKLDLWLMGLFAGLALLLAVAGIYGVISYAVAARTQEFGIRLALGADRGRLLGLVLGHGARLAMMGLVAGVAGAFALTRLLGSVLVGVSPTDATTFVAVSAVVAIVALVACLSPALRAMRTDPLAALRNE
jgi:putative ABC transport system permease protein